MSEDIYLFKFGLLTGLFYLNIALHLQIALHLHCCHHLTSLFLNSNYCSQLLYISQTGYFDWSNTGVIKDIICGCIHLHAMAQVLQTVVHWHDS